MKRMMVFTEMKRRTFLQTTGVWGLSAAMPWHLSSAQERRPAGFLTTKTADGMLFPRPEDGAEVDISPVGLAWLPCPAAASYRVDIFDEGPSRIYSRNVGADPVHCPDRVLPPGRYAWDVVALDSSGTDVARRGQHSFRIRPGAAELPWIDPKELLRRVPREHPRLLYPKSHLESIRSTLPTSRRGAWGDLKARAQKALSRGVPEFPTYHRLNDPVVQRLEYQRYFGYFRGYVPGNGRRDGGRRNLADLFAPGAPDVLPPLGGERRRLG